MHAESFCVTNNVIFTSAVKLEQVLKDYSTRSIAIAAPA